MRDNVSEQYLAKIGFLRGDYVTKIGCGIAGFKIEEIAPLFSKCIDMNNVSLPIEFINYIKS